MSKFPEYKRLNLTEINKEVLQEWENNKTFTKSLETRRGKEPFIFYEGPPSANGIPGIHHVMARTIKDVICRYKTLQGYYVERKAGWDTHGLPVELGVEKKLGITKDDIGTKISIQDYNRECRKEVMKYTELWEELTQKMGYWINTDTPYITYDNKYIETVWYLLAQLYEKQLLYKGYSIQPYSPAAGTGLSTHELNQPGCYKDVNDTTIVAQFKLLRNDTSKKLFDNVHTDIFFLAWTTTPWTLPSNTALAVGKKIIYFKIKTFNPYTAQPIVILLAKELAHKFFPEENKKLKWADYKEGDKKIPFEVLGEYKGIDLKNIRYEQLLPFQKPLQGDAFKVVTADFVTTEEGTGIVHIAPAFGADDFRIAKENNIGTLLLVDKKGKFIKNCGYLSGRYVKPSYNPSPESKEVTIDIEIAINLKRENKAFKVEKYIHSYPHCWRTDKPILYYPLDSWFIKTTDFKEKLVTLNETINWKPQSTGDKRFAKWLENLQDWNLSRSRFWGTPLPIWTTDDKKEQICIGSVLQLKQEIEKSVTAGLMKTNPLKDFQEGNFSAENYSLFDLHRPFVDEIILISPNNKSMKRETALLDVWFDSGAMPYAQLHYPFENKEELKNKFPASFIAEGVDQTRGWFFTLHTIATMIFDSVAFKNIISNGLILDKQGKKMSKRLGNAIDPFEVIEKYGADAVRWYMLTNASPWDNQKFDVEGIEEVKRKFFGTLYNTYSFFALYANIDKFQNKENEIDVDKQPEIDRWILSLLHTLIEEVTKHYNNYEPTKAGREIQEFVIEDLSNWYVRMSRKRYWRGNYSTDKISAYQTLHQCLKTVAILSSPIAPFLSDKLFKDLNSMTNNKDSVHLINFPVANKKIINEKLEEKMHIAKKISSMVLGLRRKIKIKVRQPLNKILIATNQEINEEKINGVKHIILSEINVKKIEYIKDTTNILVKKIKPNFKTLGPKYGKIMKPIVAAIAQISQEEVAQFEKKTQHTINIQDRLLTLSLEDVEIISKDIEGWLVANEGKITVALDVDVTSSLRKEGIAREFINRIQNTRKEQNLDVIDKINIEIQKHDKINVAIAEYSTYIKTQTLANKLELIDKLEEEHTTEIEIDKQIKTIIKIQKAN